MSFNYEQYISQKCKATAPVSTGSVYEITEQYISSAFHVVTSVPNMVCQCDFCFCLAGLALDAIDASLSISFVLYSELVVKCVNLYHTLPDSLNQTHNSIMTSRQLLYCLAIRTALHEQGNWVFFVFLHHSV